MSNSGGVMMSGKSLCGASVMVGKDDQLGQGLLVWQVRSWLESNPRAGKVMQGGEG